MSIRINIISSCSTCRFIYLNHVNLNKVKSCSLHQVAMIWLCLITLDTLFTANFAILVSFCQCISFFLIVGGYIHKSDFVNFQNFKILVYIYLACIAVIGYLRLLSCNNSETMIPRYWWLHWNYDSYDLWFHFSRYSTTKQVLWGEVI